MKYNNDKLKQTVHVFFIARKGLKTVFCEQF